MVVAYKKTTIIFVTKEGNETGRYRGVIVTTNCLEKIYPLWKYKTRLQGPQLAVQGKEICSCQFLSPLVAVFGVLYLLVTQENTSYRLWWLRWATVQESMWFVGVYHGGRMWCTKTHHTVYDDLGEPQFNEVLWFVGAYHGGRMVLEFQGKVLTGYLIIKKQKSTQSRFLGYQKNPLKVIKPKVKDRPISGLKNGLLNFWHSPNSQPWFLFQDSVKIKESTSQIWTCTWTNKNLEVKEPSPY